jgi:hypothetical protein
MRFAWWPFLVVAALLPLFHESPAQAGPNAGGVLIVHDVGITATGCPTDVPAPDCAGVDDRIDDYTARACWRVYAAFPDGSSPRLKGLTWGVTMTRSIHVESAQLPDPSQDFQITDGGWPNTSGCGVGQSFGTTQTDQVICCYWFTGYAEGPGQWSTTPHPVQASLFVDDASPPAVDPITDYGRLGFGLAGYTPCAAVNPVACCFPDGSCQVLLFSDCDAAGGVSYGAVPCTPSLCPALGACCYVTGECATSIAAACAASGGTWQGPSTACMPNPCSQPPGTCCYADGRCALLGAIACYQGGGRWSEVVTACEPNPCPQPQGACCLPGGGCGVMDEPSCQLAGGYWYYWEESCDPSPCPPPEGACCRADGYCIVLSQAQCEQGGGRWLGYGINCWPNPCPQTYGACCFADGGCTVHPQYQCGFLHGEFQGAGTTCTPNPCPLPGGTNAGGTLVVHDTRIAYTLDGGQYPSDPPASCSSVDGVAPPDSLVVWKVYAAFPMAGSPRLKAVAFGEDFVAGSLTILGAGLANPGDSEITVNGWPGNPGSGVTVSFANVQTGHIVELYWFGGYGSQGSTWNTAPHPTQPTVFVDDSAPAQEDLITALGGIGFGVPGYTPCSVAPLPGACCFPDGVCRALTVEECAGDHGTYVGGSCSPNPCPQPPPDGACCLSSVYCRILTPEQCHQQGGLFLGYGVACEENICPVPVPTLKVSWGMMKALFR